MLIKNQA